MSTSRRTTRHSSRELQSCANSNRVCVLMLIVAYVDYRWQQRLLSWESVKKVLATKAALTKQ